MSIEFEKVSFSYGARPALTEVTLALQPHGFHALLGPNGAGKTTLFGLITRLLSLQQGDIRVAGESMRRHAAGIMRRLGVVFQQSTLDLDRRPEPPVPRSAAWHDPIPGAAPDQC